MSDFLEAAKKTALKAGKLVLEYYKSRDFTVEDKGEIPFDYLTEADEEAQQLIIKELRDRFRDHGFRAEEEPYTRKSNKEYVWIIDPIDGTREFVRRTGQFCVQIGLTKNGRVIAGVVYFPVTKKLFYAERGKGAFLNDKKIVVSNIDKVEDMSMGVSSRISYDEDLIALYDKIKVGNKDIVHSTGRKICLIAEGEYDVTLFKDYANKEWDFCAPAIILEEAGGKVSGPNGKELVYNREETDYPFPILCSNGVIHEELLKLL